MILEASLVYSSENYTTDIVLHPVVGIIIDTLLNGLEIPCFMLRSRHTYKNGVSFFLRQFCEAIIVKLAVLLVIEGL